MTRKPEPLLFAAMIAYVAIITTPVQCRADGGRVVHIEKFDDVNITVFAAPNPLTAGPVDVSFLVQNAESLQTIPDASISIVCQKESAREDTGESTSVVAAALREHATNKLLQAAIVDLPSGGEWRVTTTVTIDRDEQDAEFEFTLSVADTTSVSEWRAAVVLPIAGIALFAIHRQLKRMRPRPQPVSFPLDAASASLR